LVSDDNGLIAKGFLVRLQAEYRRVASPAARTPNQPLLANAELGAPNPAAQRSARML
jgi:hypothetical protein